MTLGAFSCLSYSSLTIYFYSILVGNGIQQWLQEADDNIKTNYYMLTGIICFIVVVSNTENKIFNTN